MRSSGPRTGASVRRPTSAPRRRPTAPRRSRSTCWPASTGATSRPRSKANRIDFEDMLSRAVELYERDPDAIGLVRQRYAWFSVDEYQDTNPLQQSLLELWVGDRRDLCVVGDPDQTIYTFTGASADYLTGFADRWTDAQVVRLTTNYRSTPQVLAVANRLIAGKDLRSVASDGPEPQVVAHRNGELELAAIVADIGELMRTGTPGARDRDPGAHQRPARADRGGADPRRDRLHRSRRPLPRPSRGARRTHRAPSARPRGPLPDRCGDRPLAHRARLRPGRRAGFGGRGRGARSPRRAADPARHRPGAGVRERRRDDRRLPRRARAPRCRGAGGRRVRKRDHHLDPASGEGPRVGCRFPADARGGRPPHPPVARRPRRAGRGAPPPVRGHHPRPTPPRPVMGRHPHHRQGAPHAVEALALPGAAAAGRCARPGARRAAASRRRAALRRRGAGDACAAWRRAPSPA